MTTDIHDEQGYIVVETVGTFIPFVLVVVSILSLVNIVTLQSRIHHALTQTALSLSTYCYVLEALGVADDLIILDRKANEFSDSVSSLQKGINSISGDPEGMLQNLMNFGINEIKNSVTTELFDLFIMNYLVNGTMSAEEYLKSVRVASFNLVECVLIDKNKNVKITANYEVEYTFGALRLPFSPTLRITQTAITKAWLGGSGEGYKR